MHPYAPKHSVKANFLARKNSLVIPDGERNAKWGQIVRCERRERHCRRFIVFKLVRRRLIYNGGFAADYFLTEIQLHRGKKEVSGDKGEVCVCAGASGNHHHRGPLSTALGQKVSPRLRDFFRQAEVEVVSNSKNKIHRAWVPLCNPSMHANSK